MDTSTPIIITWPFSSWSWTQSLSAWALSLYARWRKQVPRLWQLGPILSSQFSWPLPCYALTRHFGIILASSLSLTGWCSSEWPFRWSHHKSSSYWLSRTRQQASCKSWATFRWSINSCSTYFSLTHNSVSYNTGESALLCWPSSLTFTSQLKAHAKKIPVW